MRLLIDTLKRLDKVDAIIMDLRANGGGSLNEAIDLTGLFIDRGPVVLVKDYANNVRINEDKDAGAIWTGPLGVMVDRLSASASEIFAGAIQDYGRGIVMGTQTYGKGTVQSSIDLNTLVDPSILNRIAALLKKDDKAKIVSPQGNSVFLDKNGVPLLGQINLTMAKFYRISGNSTQHKGVIPDFTFPSIYPMDKIGEDTEPSALPFDMIKASNYKIIENLATINTDLSKLHEQRMAKSVAFKVLLDDLQLAKKTDNEISVTLNEAKLKAERDQIDAKSLARLNQLRAARGMAVLIKGQKAPKEDAFDFMEDESLNIMADFMKVQANAKVAVVAKQI